MSETFILSVVSIILGGLFLSFLWWFVRPWQTVKRRLSRATRVLSEHDKHRLETGSPVTDLDALMEALSEDERLRHLWTEFRHTLHAEKAEGEFDEHGQQRVLRYRQTMPAEVYFSTRSLIDVPLHTNFFKHLPGMLTGLGIIGTFTGLITGLAQFTISGNPETVNRGVDDLLSAVQGAFTVSAAAIGLAMLVTFVEKYAVAEVHRLVQELQSVIDRMFDAGAGEDYLSTISTEAEKSATHLAQLKDGLVNDLKVLLEEMTQKQIDAQLRTAELISSQITGTLQEPLEAMRRTMERSIEDQQAVVHKLMDKSLDAFAQRLEDVVGQKLTDAAEEIKIGAALLRDALIEAPQRVQEAVEQVRAALELVARSTEPIAVHTERIDAAAARFATTVEQSTETLDYAIERFKRLGTEMAASLDTAKEIAVALERGAARAEGTAGALAGTQERLTTASAALTAVVEALDGVSARTETDTANQQKLAEAVERAADQLERAQRDVVAFLEGLAPALGETHEAFSRELNKTLDVTHEAFHRNLADATKTLSGTVKDLSDFVGSEFSESVDDLRVVISRMSEPPSDGVVATNGA